jgi:hypothetical protein
MKTVNEFLQELKNYFSNILKYHSADDDRIKKDDICRFVIVKIEQFQAEQEAENEK